MNLLKQIADLFYATQQAKKNFQLAHPDEQVLAADASKGIVTQGETAVERGFDWVKSQRAVILLTEKRIKCGKWDIPLETISAAKLVRVKTLMGSGQVLKITTIDQTNYQFGMQWNPEWMEQKVLPLSLEKGKQKYSVYSIVVRLLLAGVILYFLYSKFK